MGLVGLPNVGKSSTFNLLSKQSVPAENFPFCTIDPHEARMAVPDDRFQWLCEHYKPRSEISAYLTVYDIAGLVPGASKGEGLGNAFLSHIQAVDGIYHVIRAFENGEIVHTEGEIDPIRDLQTISDELRFKDIERCENRVDEFRKMVAKGHDKTKAVDLGVLEKVKTQLQSHWITQKTDWTIKEIEIINEYTFLTAKPLVYLVNLSQHDFMRKKNKWLAKIATWVNENLPGPIVLYSAEYESNLIDETIHGEDKPKSQIPKIINTGYNTLDLIHFFTTGEDEVRCWTVRKGTKAPQAAGQIHTDMEKGFICADITKYADLVECGNDAQVKAQGKLSMKG